MSVVSLEDRCVSEVGYVGRLSDEGAFTFRAFRTLIRSQVIWSLVIVNSVLISEYAHTYVLYTLSNKVTKLLCPGLDRSQN